MQPMPDRSQAAGERATAPARWHTEALWRELDPVLGGITVEVVARCGSTNDELIDRARRAGGRADQPVTVPGQLDAPPAAAEPRSPHGRRGSDVQPCLLVAEQQSAGRGRLGRAWQSRAGASLTFSLGVALAPRDWRGLSLAVGVALADALDPPRADRAADPRGDPKPLRIGLKWPNDLWLVDGDGQGAKLGGILIETVAVGAHRLAVIGVGLNITRDAADALPAGHAWLTQLDPALDAPAALHRLAQPLARALRHFERHGFDAATRARFAARDVLAGRAVVTTDAAQPQGVADGVDAHGALRLKVGAAVHAVTAGDVSVRRAGEAGLDPAAADGTAPAA